MNLNTTYSEQELVLLLQQRNEKAFSYLYDNYSGALYGIVNAVVTDREVANDVLQNVFVNIWRKIESYDPSKGRLFTWMLNIARNAAIDEVRSKGHNNSLKNVSLPENNEIAGAVTGPAIDDVGLKKVLGKLKGELRILVDMSYFQGFTHEEISKALDIPMGTVKTRIRSALIQLRTMIQ
ncbi:MAG TPA: sigma-70 family RNA polymerase sigma factor [Chitinophagaceae bacterium]|nr:sigma-70 family RNA polymerase sigma factor [Chitinophagaceae bacterium]HNU14403.1 sigma-70 family RNA polymerase sigma factor [Chitinophagaceae bacterium]